MNTRERKIEDLEERLNKQASEIKLITETTFGWYSNAYKQFLCLNSGANCLNFMKKKLIPRLNITVSTNIKQLIF